MPEPGSSLTATGLQIHVTEEEHRTHVRATGEIDAQTSRMLLEHVSTFALNKPVVALDLAEVSYIDSAGLRALWTLRKQCTDDKRLLLLEHPSATVTRVLQASRLDRVFAIPAAE